LLSTSATCEIAEAIVAAGDDYQRTLTAGKAAVRILRRAALSLSRREQQWLDRIEEELSALPRSEDEVIGEMSEKYGALFQLASYEPMAVPSR